MDLLWAPWREAYVVKANHPSKKKACVFCSILKENQDQKNYIFIRTKYSFAVLNIYPFNSGHAMAIPRRHVDDLAKLSAAELKDLMALVITIKERMNKGLKAEAFNIGINIGHAAGAGIPGHLHVHIVPRWSGDVNFMPAVFGTKIMPVSLEKIYQELVNAN